MTKFSASARLHPTPVLRLAALTVALGVLAAGGTMVCPAGNCPVPAADAAILAWFDHLHHPVADAGFAVITHAGSLGVLFPLALLLALSDRKRSGWREAIFLPLAVGGAAALAHAAKLVFARPRPEFFPSIVDMPGDPAFPSAHAMQVTAFALAWLLRPGASPGLPAVMALVLGAVLVSLSRLHIQVHFPSDVAFGVLAAALWVAAILPASAARESAR